MQILTANCLEGKENSTEGMPINQAALICIYKVPFNLSNIHTVFKNMSTVFIMWYTKMQYNVSQCTACHSYHSFTITVHGDMYLV
jgi:hypothetical protein